MRKSKKEEIKNIVHNELVEQLAEALEIELWKYAHDVYGWNVRKDITSYGGYCGVDIYAVHDDIDMEIELIHLHPEDILHCILTFDKSIERAKEYLDDSLKRQ